MIQKIFETSPGNAIRKIAELRKAGWKIITTADTSTPLTEPDAHGVSYGGPSFSILAERDGYEKPKVLAQDNPNFPFASSRPCNPPRPAGH
jgi:hypothetical protein